MEGVNQRRVALVTGASRGIGRGVALKLAEDGFDIAFCYKSSLDEAKALKEKIETIGRKCLYKQCDVAIYQDVNNFVQEVESDFGEIEVLVNNAGITSDNALMMMSPQDWHSVINTNLDSVYNFCRSSVFEFLKRKKGKIINISSVSGIYGNPGQVNYSASKAGIIGFSKSLSKEVGSRGITVNVVAPGYIETDMTEALKKDAMEIAKDRSSLKRLGSVKDVANCVSFLASEKASFITGQTICVDGGLAI